MFVTTPGVNELYDITLYNNNGFYKYLFVGNLVESMQQICDSAGKSKKGMILYPMQ